MALIKQISDFSKNNHWALWNRVTKIHFWLNTGTKSAQKPVAYLKEILKEFSPYHKVPRFIPGINYYIRFLHRKNN